MADKITYEDKIAIYNDPEVPEESKVTDENMNNIKEVVNKNADELDEAKKTVEANRLAGEERDLNHERRIALIESKNSSQDTSIKELNTTIIDLKDKAGNKLSLEIDSVNYIMTLKLLNQDDVELDSKTIDFPLESVVVNGRYEDGNVILTLQNETEISFSVAELVNGLISQETFNNAVKELQGKIDKCVKTTEFQKSQETQDQKILSLQQENEMLKGLLPTVSGKREDVTLKGTGEMTFKKLQVGGNSVQDGEPSPDNVVDIRNCGDNVNLFDEDDSWITASTSVVKADLTEGETYAVKIHNPKENSTYLVKGGTSSTSYVNFQNTCNKNNNYTGSFTYTINEDNRNFKNGICVRETVGTSSKWLSSEEIKELQIKIEKGTKATPYSPYNCGNINTKVTDNAEQQQSKTFPLEKGQVLHIGDYLADDGIHQTRKTIELDGAKSWIEISAGSLGELHCYYTVIADSIQKELSSLCSHFKNKKTVWTAENAEKGYCSDSSTSKSKFFTTDFATVDEWKQYLAQQKEAGTPVMLEYELQEEKIIPYTEEQQKAYDEIMQMTSYEDTTHVFSEDEISPIFDVTAYAKITTNEQTVQSEPTSEPPTYEESTEDEEVV